MQQSKPPFAAIEFAPPSVEMEATGDGGRVLRARAALGRYPVSLIHYLDHWAVRDPERLFLAERSGPGDAPWRRLGYGEAARSSAAVAEALLERGLSVDRPVMILSGNGVDHAILTLACLRSGIPVVPVSPAYSLMSGDFAKLRYIYDLVRPGLIYVAAGEPFSAALDAIGARRVELASSAPAPAGRAATPFASLLAAQPGARLASATARVTAETIAKILFTSGSTGLPKGVINTHGMLSANQQMLAQCWPFLARMAPALLDWLPWNHTFGGNFNLHLVLRHGGSLHIDAGKPAPGLVEQTVANLREVSPNIYFNVPAGFAALLPYLERDDDLARRFLANLKLIFYAAAALPQDLWVRLEKLAIRHLGHRVTMTSAWGSTETAPLATLAHFPLEGAGVIGVPVPGVEIRMVPSGSKMELRVRGPNVTPGYFKRPDLTAAAFDADGFYRIGDAGRLADEADPSKGLVFDGRTAEDFKLATGTWVHTGALRVALLAACSPLIQDAVVCGHDRDAVCVLAWPSLNACREIAGSALEPAALVGNPGLLAVLSERLESYNRTQSGSSTRIARLLLLAEPPSIDANEITDKGYINQRATLERRHADVERLYADPPEPAVVVAGP
ncbi:MAG: feruloyl-CoA synthase [Alphaproteobacteria bacterium]|nr:feruloyl-CoA synthase [Alphaproteobacteria bacterium]